MEVSEADLAVMPQPIHPSWVDRWDVVLDDEKLKRSLFANPRLAKRIAYRILALDADWISSGPSSSDVKDIIAHYNTSEMLRNIGLAWCAPRLFYCLMATYSRDACGPLSPSQIADQRKFRNHSPINKIPILPHSNQIEAEGQACLIAWLSDQSSPEIKVLLTNFDAEHVSQLTELDARANLFELYIKNAQDVQEHDHV